jgi:sugar (pentulose or hexulose) kinase
MSTIGLDLGTSRVKAVRFDGSWRAVDSEAHPTAVLHNDDGRSEQDMHGVWAAAARVLSAVVGRSPDPVDLVALTAQGDGCWLVDGHGEPVGPALLWNDRRSAEVVEKWRDDGTLERAFRINGCYGSPGVAHAQLRWLLDHEPDTVARAARLLSCGSWVYQRLTGRQVVERSDAANPFLDANTGCYDERLLDLFGIAALDRLLPAVVSGVEAVAPLSPGAAGELGLPAGTPVALAPYDVVATAAGTGAIRTGDAYAILGTTLCVGIVAADPMLARAPNGMTLPTGTPGQWLIAEATMVGTEVLDWTANLLGLATAADLVELAATSRTADRPLLLPYLSPAGERSPFLDPTIRGSLHGLTLRHSRADIARAALDGLTLAVRDCLATAGRTATLALSGGGARSELWCRSIADATGCPVTGPDTPEAGARGAVLVGATGIGMVGSLGDAVALAVQPSRVYEPDPGQVAWFDDAYARYRALR